MPQHKKLSQLTLRLPPPPQNLDPAMRDYLQQYTSALQAHFNAISGLDIMSGLTRFDDSTNKGYFLGFARGVSGVDDGTPVFIVGDRANGKYFEFDGSDVNIGINTKFPGVDAFNNGGYYRHFYFEAVDGYDKTTSGSGSISAVSSGASISASASGDSANLVKDLGNYFLDAFSYSDIRFRASMTVNSSATFGAADIFCGVGLPPAGKRIGFQIRNATILLAVCDNGVSETSSSLGNVSNGDRVVVEFVMNGSSSVDFSVSGAITNSATISTNVPTGTGSVALSARAALSGAETCGMTLHEALFISP